MHMTNTIQLHQDFNKWATRFNELTVVVHERHLKWRDAFTNGTSKTLKEAEVAWDNAEKPLQEHFFSRYSETKSFWKEYLDSFYAVLPVAEGYAEDAAATRADYLDRAKISNCTPETCRKLDLFKLHSKACNAVSMIIWAHGYTNDERDVRPHRSFVKVQNTFSKLIV